MNLSRRKGLIALLVIAFMLASTTLAGAAVPNPTTNQLYKSGEILVQFKAGTTPSAESLVH